VKKFLVLYTSLHYFNSGTVLYILGQLFIFNGLTSIRASMWPLWLIKYLTFRFVDLRHISCTNCVIHCIATDNNINPFVARIEKHLLIAFLYAILFWIFYKNIRIILLAVPVCTVSVRVLLNIFLFLFWLKLNVSITLFKFYWVVNSEEHLALSEGSLRF
jgi:hypothetical protein